MRREPIFNAPASVVNCLALLAAIHLVLWHVLPDRMAIKVLEYAAFIPARYSGAFGELAGGWPAAIWTFLTHQLIHGDVTHLLLNSAWLLVFGGAIAMRVGALRYLVFAVLSGIVGALVFLAFRFGDPVPMIGASGAVSGLMGGALRFFFSAMDRGGFDQFRSSPNSVPLMSVKEVCQDKRFQTLAMVIVMINIVMSAAASAVTSADGIAWQSHLGGFLFGLFSFHRFERPKPVRPNLKIVPPTLH